MTEQISIFDGDKPFRIEKPIRLIELFAWYGSQALALKYLGIPFEHYKISEWAAPSIKAYKYMHFGDDNTDYSDAMTKDDLVNTLCGRNRNKMDLIKDFNNENRFGRCRL